VYSALEIPFDPKSVGSVREAGSDATPGEVCRAVETALVAGTSEDRTTIRRTDVSEREFEADDDADPRSS
jgi:hypothetical protein